MSNRESLTINQSNTFYKSIEHFLQINRKLSTNQSNTLTLTEFNLNKSSIQSCAMFINAPSLPCVFKNDIDTQVLTKKNTSTRALNCLHVSVIV